MTDLFQVPESISPKLAWLLKHRLTTVDQGAKGWCCRNGGYTKIGTGADEETAILDFCERFGLVHWTLEDLQ